MNFRSYLRIFRERLVVFSLVVLFCIGISVLITVATPKSYSAQAQVFVTSNADASSPVDQNNGQAAVLSQVSTYAQLIGSPDVLTAVRSELGVNYSDVDLRAKITASAPNQQTLIDIAATDGDAARAAALANSAAAAFTGVVEDLTRPTGSTRSPVRLTVFQQATAPGSPTTPNTTLNIGIGVILGLLLGATAAVARDLLDNRVKGVDALAELVGAPAMGAVVDDRRTNQFPIASQSERSRARAESFRQLRANLQFADVDRHPRVIAVTSSVSAEGKSAVSLNLASTLAEAGVSVCLVDANLRDPTIASLLDMPNDVGLTSVLIRQASLTDAVKPLGPNLHVLPGGPIPPNPSELLASVAARELIATLLERFHYVVLDSASLLPVADGAEVAGLCEGVLFVSRKKFTTETQVRRSVLALERVGAHVLGVVLNRVPDEGIPYSQRPMPKADEDAALDVIGREPPVPTGRHISGGHE